MHCRSYTGTVSNVLCREVYYTVSLLRRVHYHSCTVDTREISEVLWAYLCSVGYEDQYLALAQRTFPVDTHEDSEVLWACLCMLALDLHCREVFLFGRFKCIVGIILGA